MRKFCASLLAILLLTIKMLKQGTSRENTLKICAHPGFESGLWSRSQNFVPQLLGHNMLYFCRNCENPSKPRGVVGFDSCRTILMFTTRMLLWHMLGPVAMNPSSHFLLSLRHLASIFPIKGKRFLNDESLVSEVKAWFQTQPAEFYGRGLHNCTKRWEKIITLAEAYVEKN